MATWADKVTRRAKKRERDLVPFMEGVSNRRGPKDSVAFDVAAEDDIDAAAAVYLAAVYYGAVEIAGSYDGPGVYRFDVQLTSKVELTFAKEEP